MIRFIARLLIRRVPGTTIANKEICQPMAESTTAPLPALRSVWFWLPLIVLAIFHARYFLWLSVEWGLNSNYGFGPLVPVGAGVLVYLRLDRWRTPRAPDWRAVHLIVPVIAALGLLPLAVIAEVNPDWRLLMWLEAGLLAVMSLSILFSLGGWPWVKAAVPVLAFLALCIPWPTRFEQWLLSLLLEGVSVSAADVFYLLGHDVIRRGSLLYMDGIALGIDEACSGVRSLQLVLVVVAFLCLWRPLSPLRTLGLIIGGVAACFIGNLARIVVLGTLGVSQGQASLESWHDMAGGVATFMIIGGILVIRWLVQPPPAPMNQLSRLEQFRSDRALAERRIGTWPRSMVLPLLAIAALQWASVPLYYGAAPEGSGYRVRFDWESAMPGFESLPIPAAVTEQMRYSNAERFEIDGAGAWSLQGYSFYWEDGRISSFTAVHRPENCLPSIGYRMVSVLRPLAFPIRDAVLPVHRYLFEMQGREFFVYHAFWDTAKGIDAIHAGNVGDRLEAVSERERLGPRQALLFMVAGNLRAEQANALLIELIRRARIQDAGNPGE